MVSAIAILAIASVVVLGIVATSEGNLAGSKDTTTPVQGVLAAILGGACVLSYPGGLNLWTANHSQFLVLLMNPGSTANICVEFQPELEAEGSWNLTNWAWENSGSTTDPLQVQSITPSDISLHVGVNTTSVFKLITENDTVGAFFVNIQIGGRSGLPVSVGDTKVDSTAFGYNPPGVNCAGQAGRPWQVTVVGVTNATAEYVSR